MLSFINSEDQLFKGFMDTAVRLFASEILMYYARGNHETRGVFATEINVIFLPVRNIFIMPFDKVLSIVLFWIREKISLILIFLYCTEQSEWLASILESTEYKEAPLK